MKWTWSGVFLSLLSAFVLCSPFSAQAYVNWGECTVQSGEGSVLPNSANRLVTLAQPVSSVDKAFILLNTTGTSGVAGADDHFATAEFSNTLTMIVTRGSATSTALSFTYQVVHCPNNEFTVQHGVGTIPANSGATTLTIPSVDAARSLVAVSTRTTDTTTTEVSARAHAALSNDTSLVLSRATTSSTALTVRYQIITFSPESNVSVQSSTVPFAGTLVSKTAIISAVDLARSWIYCAYTTASNTLRSSSVSCDISNATTVTVRRHLSTNYTNSVRFSVVQFPPDAVKVQRAVSASNNPNTADGTRYDHNIAITPVSQLSRAFVAMTNTTRGTGTQFPRNSWMGLLTSTSNIRFSFFRGDATGSTDQNSKYWQVVEFLSLPVPVIVSVTGGSNTPTLVAELYAGTATHTTTDWKIVTTENCVTGASVWESMSSSEVLSSIADAAHGSFVGSLAGQQSLADDTGYYACARYMTTSGSTGWSVPFYFSTNQSATASQASVNGGATSITLSPGTTKTVTGTVLVVDQDSCQDIQSVSGAFYRTSMGSEGATDGAYRYTASCTRDVNTCSGPTDTTASYTCSFPVQYYADATDSISQQASDSWTFQATPYDSFGMGTAVTDTIEMGSLTAMSVVSGVTFGTLGPGASTGSTNEQIAVTNIGNTRLDVLISAYGSSPGDDLAMECTEGAVPVHFLKFASSNFNFTGSGISASSDIQEMDLDIMKVGAGPSTRTIYTGLQMPETGVKGSCQGVISISAQYDSIND